MTSSEANRSPANMLVPDAIRKRFGRVKFYIRFDLPKSKLAEYARVVAKLGLAKEKQSSFTVTPSNDKELAISVHSFTRGSSHFHAVVECRRGDASPYRRVPADRLRHFMNFVDNAARSLALEHWQEWTSVRREALLEQLPDAAKLVGAGKLRIGGRDAAFSGFSVAVEQQEDKPRAGLSFDWSSGDRVVFSAWTEGGALTAIREAASKGEALMGDLLAAASESQEREDGNG